MVVKKHHKFATQKVTIATDRIRKSCVFFSIVDWFIHSRQNNKLLSAIFSRYTAKRVILLLRKVKYG